MIASFLQLRNESVNGNLRMCLDNCSRYADEIFIYDDCSTDDSRDVYLEYTSEKNIIFGSEVFGDEVRFKKELFNKQMLLDLTLSRKPDWIVWQDGDAIFDAWITKDCRYLLKKMDEDNFDGIMVHVLNLWRHPAFHRLDSGYNDLYYLCFWKNNGELRYDPSEGLHKAQFPKGMNNAARLPENNAILHYGFASEERIAKKYFMYKELGQSGWELNRLVDERNLQLRKIPRKMFPTANFPVDYDSVQSPQAISYNKYRHFNSWDEYVTGKPTKTHDGPKFSIVMTYWNRREQLFRTLKSIQLSKYSDDCEIIIVDDASDHNEMISDFPDKFPMPMKIIRIEDGDRWWHNPCIPFNIGLLHAKGDVVVLQNPETIHFGDVLSDIYDRVDDSIWATYSCYAINKPITDRLPSIEYLEENPNTNIHDSLEIMSFPVQNGPAFNVDQVGWYNHPSIRRTAFHFLAATKRKNIQELQGFDERYAHGAAWDDNEIIRRAKRKGLEVVIVDPRCSYVIHQWHSSGRKTEDFMDLYYQNGVLFYAGTVRERSYVPPFNFIFTAVKNESDVVNSDQ